MKCPVCGANNSDDAQFCNLCLTPFGKGKLESPPATSEPSTPRDYPDDTEQPTGKHPGKLSDRVIRIVLVVVCLIVVIPPAIIFLPPIISEFFPPERWVDCLRVDETTFQEEVLESQTPVLVVFCTDELWRRYRTIYFSRLGHTQPAPIIIAVKRIIKEGEYENKIKFCKYYRESSNDPVGAEYDIKWLPTTIVFRDGSVFWKAEGGGCFAEDCIETLEVILKEAIGEGSTPHSAILTPTKNTTQFVTREAERNLNN
jgi:hypothetical protein